jgi:4-amino-4-deoxy-L-arabinose transferase
MRWAPVAILGLFLLVYILPLGVRPMFIPDETRYGEIPREMLASGDWIVPRLDGVRYFEKPVLGYWLNAISMMLFGQNAFAIRFPSALAAAISALTVFLLVRRFAGGTAPGCLAAAALLTFGEFFGVGTFCVLDTLFSMFVTASLACFYFACRAEGGRRTLLFLALFGLFCGLAFLTKGFLAFALPAVTIVPFLLWERRWKDLFRLPWVPMLTVALVSLPWCLAIASRETDFWNYFFWTEHIKRYLSAENFPQHPQPFWYFLPILPAGALPWTTLFPAVLQGVRRESRLREPFLRFTLCWLVFPFLFLSGSGGKLGTYILPCFPPLAVIIAAGLWSYFETGGGRAFRYGTLLVAVGVAAMGAALVLNQLTGFPGVRAYAVHDTWKAFLAAFGLLAWALALRFALSASDAGRKLVLFCAGPVALFFCTPFLMPEPVIASSCPEGILLRHADRVTPGTPLMSDHDLVRAACWFYKRSDVYLVEDGGELDYGLGYEDARHRFLPLDRFRRLVGPAGSGRGRIVLIVMAWRYERWSRTLPRPVFMDKQGKFVLAEFALSPSVIRHNGQESS